MDVHYTTLYRWLKGYKATGTLTGLLPQKSGRKKGEIRTDSQAEAIVQDVIQKFYLTKQKPSAQVIINKVNAECLSKNITAPSKNTIRNRISQISEYDRLRRQGNKGLARTIYEPAPNSFEADFPLQVVQIDHTPVDIILVDDETREPIGRPWITLAIDIYSRMIPGYYLSLDAPSTTSIAMCVANSVLPKDEWLLKNGVEADWDVWGFMHTIHTDNGADFRSGALQRACQTYGINLEFRPVKKPNFGGHIERLIGTVMKEVHAIPGTTFSNIQERQTYDSDGNACMTFSEFETWLVTFITKVYHKRKHTTLGVSPEAKWREGIFGNMTHEGIGYPPKPSDALTIMIDFLPMFSRTIQKNGVNIDGLNYYDHVLRPMINQIDSLTNKKQQYIFKRDPRDISYVWFYETNTQNYYRIPLANQAIPNMSLWEYEAAKKLLKSQRISNHNDHELIAAHEELHRQVQNSVKKTKKARRSIQKAKIQEHGNSFVKNTKAKEPQVTSSVETDDSLWDDNIPVFD